MQSVTRNLVWGLAWGCAFACGFSVYVSLLATRRSVDFAVYGMSLPQIVLAYFAAGIMGGIVAGLLRPLIHTRGDAAFFGSFVGPFLYGAVAFAMGYRGGDLLITALAAGVPAGAICGYCFSKPESQDTQPSGDPKK